MDSWNKFNETSLPPPGNFYSSLSTESLSQEDYEHAHTVWREFGCHSMGDYHNLYLYTDTLHLANMFNESRNICLANYDPIHFYTNPGLSWDAILKLTKVRPKLLTSPPMLSMVKSGIRGGIVQAVHRLSHANNPTCRPTIPPLWTSTLYTSISTTFMAGKCLSLYLWVDLGGFSMLTPGMHRKYMIWLDITERDICWKLMSITHVIFTIYTTICHFCLKS